MEINPDTLEIEIVDIEPIDGGVQVFARAWSDGKQIGFGKDGTVDIERFRLFNPPVLVDDPTGEIVRVYETQDPETGEVTNVERRLREDVEQALIISIADIITLMENTHPSTNIAPGKRGNTTSTFYPVGDNGLWRQSTGGTWADIRSGATGTLYVGNNKDIMFGEKEGSSWNLSRHHYSFDTSTLGTDSITSATFSRHKNSITLDGTETTYPADMVLVESNIAGDTPGSGDWNNIGAVLWSDTTILRSNTTAGYKEWPLNATGISNIDKSGRTKLAIRTTNDLNNNAPSARSYSRSWFFSDATGTADDPKLVVEHEAGGPTPTPSARRLLLMGM